MVVLYTNHCPLCNGLKSMLDANKIEYTEETDIDKMISLGLGNSPMPRLGVPGEDHILTYKEAIQWINRKR